MNKDNSENLRTPRPKLWLAGCSSWHCKFGLLDIKVTNYKDHELNWTPHREKLLELMGDRQGKGAATARKNIVWLAAVIFVFHRWLLLHIASDSYV